MKKLIKKSINMFLTKAFGLRIYSIRVHGREDVNDIIRMNHPVTTIIDVGANIGQSAIKFREAFPDSTIYCFEPVESICDKLRANMSKDRRIHIFCTAMGSKQGIAQIYITDHETTSSLLEPQYYREKSIVNVNTVDDFCAEHGIVKIDILKVDAEGFDMEVLRGANQMLTSDKIRFVLVELCFHKDDTRHVLFDAVRDYLFERNFFLYGIYDQQLEWSGKHRLRFANACFMREVQL